MRGKDSYQITDALGNGITPAYAGKSTKYEYGERELGDHPRLCGEKSTIHHVLNKEIGSPPPMRGKVFLAPLVLSVIRITPAYAGKRLTQCPESW